MRGSANTNTKQRHHHYSHSRRHHIPLVAQRQQIITATTTTLSGCSKRFGKGIDHRPMIDRYHHASSPCLSVRLPPPPTATWIPETHACPRLHIRLSSLYMHLILPALPCHQLTIDFGIRKHQASPHDEHPPSQYTTAILSAQLSAAACRASA
ncbi:uncharacterized protein LY79DRAFT_101239 [Colletotrichum navitas]|uniref:Uncharacterized protein n=1 Tax=Colletotrichum navitas TaxID=681940 RepID=A0AAD8Q453_9PEZI|nr:uncharacterized protein LY79DRAFT_101239 [Colletotrichum navitas]KAK1595537.1 hypothetical protein LY79DRAFT_101239 [Colletotrichum navitas]